MMRRVLLAATAILWVSCSSKTPEGTPVRPEPVAACMPWKMHAPKSGLSANKRRRAMLRGVRQRVMRGGVHLRRRVPVPHRLQLGQFTADVAELGGVGDALGLDFQDAHLVEQFPEGHRHTDF